MLHTATVPPPAPSTTGFSNVGLNDAVSSCIKISPEGNCVIASYGLIEDWDVSRVTKMPEMFYHASVFNADLSKWDVSGVTGTMGMMFSHAYVFDSDLSKWDVSRVTGMGEMFYKAYAFDRDLSNWNVSSVKSMYSMFSNANSFNADLSKWDVSRVTDMRNMFREAGSFNANLSKWDVPSSSKIRSGMFYGTTSFKQTLCGEAWVNSNDPRKFSNSAGSISATICGGWWVVYWYPFVGFLNNILPELPRNPTC